jgi:hypothetical protein
LKALVLFGFPHFGNLLGLAVIGRTKPKHGTQSRGKSVENVRELFVSATMRPTRRSYVDFAESLILWVGADIGALTTVSL